MSTGETPEKPSTSLIDAREIGARIKGRLGLWLGVSSLLFVLIGVGVFVPSLRKYDKEKSLWSGDLQVVRVSQDPLLGLYRDVLIGRKNPPTYDEVVLSLLYGNHGHPEVVIRFDQQNNMDYVFRDMAQASVFRGKYLATLTPLARLSVPDLRESVDLADCIFEEKYEPQTCAGFIRQKLFFEEGLSLSFGDLTLNALIFRDFWLQVKALDFSKVQLTSRVDVALPELDLRPNQSVAPPFKLWSFRFFSRVLFSLVNALFLGAFFVLLYDTFRSKPRS